MYWYRQQRGGGLQLIVYSYVQSNSIEKEFQDRFHAERRESSLFLSVKELTAADTAVYYCAKQDAQCSVCS
ncbi:UNVERIFIED_CONTAM: hypothetical protein FKN15_068758 [Acipenser sinensis]